jgi:hypothetical protein
MNVSANDTRSDPINLIYIEFIITLNDGLEIYFDLWYPWATKLLIHLLHSEHKHESHIIDFLRIFASLTSLHKHNSPTICGRDLESLPKKEKAQIYSILRHELISNHSSFPIKDKEK